MKLEGILRMLDDPIQAPDEETYDLFSQNIPSHLALGYIDPKSTILELTIGDRDLAIYQSPGVLKSNRTGGTTGAVVWKITPLFAEWITTANPLLAHGLLSPSSVVIELGCGVSGLVGLLLAPLISHYVLTDMGYVAKLVEQNIAGNAKPPASKKASKGSRSKPSKLSPPFPSPFTGQGQIHFAPLDWEIDEVTPSLTGSSSAKSFDAVVACDCVYNEALIEPFVATCVDICRLRTSEAAMHAGETGPGPEPCVCIVGQQLRDPAIFEAWLACFSGAFETWRMPDEMLLEGLRANSGFVVHIGVLKGSAPKRCDSEESLMVRCLS
ncbi:hypothetical protein B0H67DRAFT_246993 [Lasiosphaeris hirsuta]|uniref:Diaminohydroxyphosphoribosylamino-pyrimidine deaminase n=1 Tax=Lasiosphaeris hirsuta TaxID=260670 RepID=A0AA40AGZ3_9PEZI|nr:hypothetical protein B0H67DRAFT_246993 [Lasiosphaeris hirsuta]